MTSSPELSAPAFVIFGGTGGIGSAVARRLVGRGWSVAVAARNVERLTAAASTLGCDSLEADCLDGAQVEAALRAALTRFGRLDGVACCVGSLLLKPAHLTSDAEWTSTIAANLFTAFCVLRASVSLMLETDARESDGQPAAQATRSIVLISSAAASVGMANHEAIAAAKSGVMGLARSAAASYAARGIRVNCVAPGLVETPLTARLTASDLARRAATSLHAIGRIGEPDDVAAAIEWLLDPASSWVTGQVIGVDGGLASLRVRGGGG